VLVVITGVDRPDLAGDRDWKPPYNWAKGQTPREAAVRARIEALRANLPPTVTEFVAVGLAAGTTFGVIEDFLPTLASLLHRAERAALIRHLHRAHSRSKARRLVSQVSQHGRSIWKSIRSGRKSQADAQQTPTS
jgi:hypothetical protein